MTRIHNSAMHLLGVAIAGICLAASVTSRPAHAAPVSYATALESISSRTTDLPEPQQLLHSRPSTWVVVDEFWGTGYDSETGVYTMCACFTLVDLDWSLDIEVAGHDTEFTSNAVPEPGTLALLGLGCAAIVAVRRRKMGLRPRA